MAWYYRFRSLKTTNLFILMLRLVQFFFAGMVVGIIGNFIHDAVADGNQAPSPMIFIEVVGASTLLTQFLYCFRWTHQFLFFWDAVLGAGWFLGFAWLLNYEQGSLDCPYSAFNPFGTSSCGQMRAALVLQIVLGATWLFTSLLGFISLIQTIRRDVKEVIEEVV